MKYTKEQINEIIELRGNDGELIDIFDLHGVLFVGTTQNGTWNLDKNYTQFSEHSLFIDWKAFEDCQTVDDVHVVFHEELLFAVKEKLV